MEDPGLGTDLEVGFSSPASTSLQDNSRVPADEDAIEESPKSGRLRIANVGGSLTVLLQIALVAWGVRQLRSVLAKRRQRAEAARKATELPYRAVDPPGYSVLSAVAVQRLVELDPVPHVLVDVRYPSAVQEAPSPFELVFTIPEQEVRAALKLTEADWEDKFPSSRKPGRNDIIVFLSSKSRRAQKAASVAADLGFNGCCVLAGGLEAYNKAERTGEDKPLKFLSRDAVAVLMQNTDFDNEVVETGASAATLIDVRRHDERSLYGHIKGSRHVPVEEVPKALSMDSDVWEKTYHFPKFGADDKVIFQCRTSRRASWAAQLAQDAGIDNCYVYRQGAYGWRFDPSVLPYDSYEIDEAPPRPLDFELEFVDEDAGRRELTRLGIL